MAKGVRNVAWTTGALWLAASLLSAQPPGPGEGPGVPRGGRMAQLLGLNDQQQSAFQKLLEQQRPEMEALHSELRDVRQKLESALAAENPDAGAVGELAIQQHRLMEKQRALQANADQALRSVLTPEQQSKLDVLQSLRTGPGSFGPGRGPRMGAGPFGGHWGAGRDETATPVERR